MAWQERKHLEEQMNINWDAAYGAANAIEASLDRAHIAHMDWIARLVEALHQADKPLFLVQAAYESLGQKAGADYDMLLMELVNGNPNTLSGTVAMMQKLMQKECLRVLKSDERLQEQYAEWLRLIGWSV